MQYNVTWQTSLEYHWLAVPSGRTLNYILFMLNIKMPEIFESSLVYTSAIIFYNWS